MKRKLDERPNARHRVNMKTREEGNHEDRYKKLYQKNEEKSRKPLKYT